MKKTVVVRLFLAHLSPFEFSLLFLYQWGRSEKTPRKFPYRVTVVVGAGGCVSIREGYRALMGGGGR